MTYPHREMYSCKMASDQAPDIAMGPLLEFALVANAKLRTETSKLQLSLDDQTAGIQALIEHAARVENHARHVENVTKHKYESSFSWKITFPVRKLSQLVIKVLKRLNRKSRG